MTRTIYLYSTKESEKLYQEILRCLDDDDYAREHRPIRREAIGEPTRCTLCRYVLWPCPRLLRHPNTLTRIAINQAIDDTLARSEASR